MINHKMVPSIRFKGFTNDWEQRRVTELGEIYIGLVTTMTSHYTDHGTLLIRNSDIKDGFFELGGEPIYLDEVFAKQNASRKHRVGDVITVHTGDIGTSAVVTENEAGSLGFATIVTRPIKDKVISDFLCIYLNTDTHKNFAMNISTGDGRNNYNLKDYYQCEVPVPSIQEQEKISVYILKINNLIALHKKKHDKLLNLKKSMLEKMFPKEGEAVPKIRFKDFTDNWKQHKLEEVYQKIGNAFVGTATPYYSEIGHFYLESNNVKDGQINHYTEVFINDEFYEKQKDKWLHEGDMVMVQSGHVGHAAVIPKELNNTAAHALIMFKKPIIKVEPYFLNYQYQTLKAKKQIDNITVGNTVKHILASDMQNFIVDFPDYDEQNKVASFFKSLDNLITLQHRKIEKLKNIKKAMLGKMFV